MAAASDARATCACALTVAAEGGAGLADLGATLHAIMVISSDALITHRLRYWTIPEATVLFIFCIKLSLTFCIFLC